MVTLTPEQQVRLSRLAAAPSSRQSAAMRARIVLGCSRSSATQVADELGIAYNTVVKWCRRFVEADVDGLVDRARTGRPTTVTDDDVQSVLTAPMRPPPPGGWTTRAVARDVGLSQTAVSRIRRRRFGEPGDPSPIVLPGPQMLVWVHLEAEFLGLGFHTPATAPAQARPGKERGRAAMTEHVRAVLSAGLVLPERPVKEWAVAEQAAAGRAGGDERPDRRAGGGEDPVVHLRRLHALVPPDRRATVVLDSATAPHHVSWLQRNPRFGLVTVDRESWSRMLPGLVAAIDHRQTEEIADLVDRLRGWAASGAEAGLPFDWHHVPSVVGRRRFGPDESGDARPPGADTEKRKASTTTEPGKPRLNLAGAVADALRELLANGTFHAGERIPEAPLAARLGVSRGPIRDALHMLAEDGLIELRPHRGACVPAPTRRDVFDTYSGRGPLGALLLRRLAVSGERDMRHVRAAHEEVVSLARLGDVASTSDADIRWQDACARAAGMPRVEKMFTRLSLQLRMFISIMGLDYGYSMDDIVTDNGAILRALEARDADLVTELWRRKTEAAVRYMAAQLGDDVAVAGPSATPGHPSQGHEYPMQGNPTQGHPTQGKPSGPQGSSDRRVSTRR